MTIVIGICGLAIIFAYEIRYRVILERLTNLDNETYRLDEEVRKLKDDLAKKQDIETKKGFKLPFFP